MILGGTTPHGVLRESVDLAIDFCVQTLVAERLRVPPFMEHPEATARSTQPELTVGDWMLWFDTVVRARSTLSEYVRDALTREPPAPRFAEDMLIRAEASRPSALWQGSAAVGERLEVAWERHGADETVWAGDLAARGGSLALTNAERTQLIRGAARVARPSAVVNVWFVRYRVPVCSVVRPDNLVVAPGPNPSAAIFLRLVSDGITRLGQGQP